MPKGPPVSEIFANVRNAQRGTAAQNDAPLSMMSQKKTLAPLPPMKKFGGYKPKILSDNGDGIVPLRHEQVNSYISTSGPVDKPQSPRSALTQPKPFIIGDKDIPMTLSTVEDGDGGANPRIEDMHIYEDPATIHGKALAQSHIASADEGFTASDEEENLINEKRTNGDVSRLATDNPVFQAFDVTDADSGVEPEHESEGVFIPAPDYDEDEKCMTFDEEDPDEVTAMMRQQQNERERQRQISTEQHRRQSQQHLDPGMRVYAGEDLSKYLHDDEDDFRPPPPLYVQNQSKVKSKSAPVTLSEKHSLFKPKPIHNTTGKRKSSKAPVFNTVRNFSYADSKYGTRGKAAGMKMSEFSGDFDQALAAKDGGYDMFLRSKHGVDEDSPEAFPQWKQKDGNVFKKMTVRLKMKMQKKGNNDHF